MIIKVDFTIKKKKYCFVRDEASLDRNNPDEETAYFIEKQNSIKPKLGRFMYLEINIDKQRGALVPSGYVAVYFSMDDVAPARMLRCRVTFLEPECPKIIRKRLVVKFISNYINEQFECRVDYDNDIQIDEGVCWRAYGIEPDKDSGPEITIFGNLDQDNNPTTENLLISIEHIDHMVEHVRYIKVVDCK